MKIISKIVAAILIVISITGSIPIGICAVSSYTVTLHCGPEGTGETVTLTKIAGQPLSLACKRADIKSKYGLEPAGGSSDQRFFIKWSTSYDETTSRGTGEDYYNVYNVDADVALYAIWGFEVVYNADGGVFPDGKTKHEDYVCNFNDTDYSDPKTVYGLHGFPDGENAPVKEGCRRVTMSSGEDFFALLKTTMYMYTTETAQQNLTIPPTGGTVEWKTFKNTTTSKGNPAIEFYVVWEPSVTYHPNGGLGEAYEEYLDWNWSRLWRYESYAIADNSFTHGMGGKFTGWNTKPDGSGKSYEPGRKYTYFANNSDPLVLYAQWDVTHEHSYESTVTEATCGKDGKIVYTCACGHSYTEIIPATGRHDHTVTITEPTCSEDGYFLYVCACGDTYTETIPATGEHDYTITVIDPTCVKDGVIRCICECGDVFEELLPATGEHEYAVSTVDPTCSKDGCIIYTCECGITLEEVLPATGEHDYSITIVDSTCNADGKFVYECQNCTVKYEERIPATGDHKYGLIESVDPGCTTDGFILYTCEFCQSTDTEILPALGHDWGAWVETIAPTTEKVGKETRICETCSAAETREVPMLVGTDPAVKSVKNYTVTLNNINNIKEIRYALGHYTKGQEVREAEKNQTLSAALVNSLTVDGVMTYEVPWVGEYTFWVRLNDGSSCFLYCDVNEIAPYLESDGLRLTVKDFGENYKDMWIAEGTYNSYSEIKNNATVKYQAAAAKLSNYFADHDFTYTTADPGAHTVLIRYNDGTQDVMHIDLTVDVPTFDVNGLQVTVGNIPGVKIIRTAYGEYANVAEIKKASGVRNFNNKTAIKDAESYRIQYRDNGVVTVIVEYATGYKHVEHIDIQAKTSTLTQDGSKVTIGNFEDGLVMVRYAEGTYKTSNGVKNADGSKYVKADAAVNGEITVENLAPGKYTFCVQYDDESFNFHYVTVA